jgi:hypothetical protein
MVTIRKLFVIMLLVLIAIISLTVQAQNKSGQSTESQLKNLPLELEDEEQVFQFPSAAGKVVPAGSLQETGVVFKDLKSLNSHFIGEYDRIASKSKG